MLFRNGGPVDHVLRLLGTDEGDEQLVSRSKAREVIEGLVTGRVTEAESEAWVAAVRRFPDVQ